MNLIFFAAFFFAVMAIDKQLRNNVNVTFLNELFGCCNCFVKGFFSSPTSFFPLLHRVRQFFYILDRMYKLEGRCNLDYVPKFIWFMIVAYFYYLLENIFNRLQLRWRFVQEWYRMRTVGTRSPVLGRTYSGIQPCCSHEKKQKEYKNQIVVHFIFPIEKFIAYQCKRSVCKKAERPSINTKMPTVSTPQNPKMIHRIMPPYQLSMTKPWRRTMFHSTSANSVDDQMIMAIMYEIREFHW